MSTNEQRRAAARRKLARRNERAVQRAKRRKRIIIASSIVVVVAVLVTVGIVLWNRHEASVEAAHAADVRAHTCAYKPNKREQKQLPKNKQVGLPPNPYGTPKKGTVQVRFTTNQGAIPVTLDRSKAPCTVQSIKHLVDKHFYDNTKCHREVNAPPPTAMKILQCGDPLGNGTGGPGYTSPDELAAAKKLPNAPKKILAAAGGQPVKTYPRGTIAMANSGKNTNGSQFFFVFGDSYLPPNYNVIGTVDQQGLQTLDAIAKNGITPGMSRATGQPTPQDGKPKKPVTIQAARVIPKS